MSATQKATYPIQQGYQALRLYRQIMKLHLRKMPEELRNFGDLYVKQEFRLHLDKSNEDQMVKFMKGWHQYKEQMEGMDMSSKRAIKDSLMDPSLDEMIKDKLSEEQMSTLHELKEVVYDNEKYKQYNPKK